MTRRDHVAVVVGSGETSAKRHSHVPSRPYPRAVTSMTMRRGAALLTGALLTLPALALQAPSHAATGRTDDGYFAGKVLNQATNKPVKGVTVKVFRINTDTLLGSDDTGSEGRYRIDGLSADDEELDVRVNGRAVHFETGWVACSFHVVQSWGLACSHGQGRQDPILIQHL